MLVIKLIPFVVTSLLLINVKCETKDSFRNNDNEARNIQSSEEQVGIHNSQQPRRHNIHTRAALFKIPPIKRIIDNIADHIGFQRKPPRHFGHHHNCFHRHGYRHPPPTEFAPHPPYLPHDGMENNFHNRDKYPSFPIEDNKHENKEFKNQHPGLPVHYPDSHSSSETPQHNFPNENYEPKKEAVPDVATPDEMVAKHEENEFHADIPSHVFKKTKDEDYPTSDFDKSSNEDVPRMTEIENVTDGVTSHNFEDEVKNTVSTEGIIGINTDVVKLNDNTDATGWVTVRVDIDEEFEETSTASSEIDIRFSSNN